MIATTESSRAVLLAEVIDRLQSAYGEPPRLAEQPPVDELIQTILSQHTSDVNTNRAFASLRSRFPNWDAVIEAPTSEVADAIRSGGLADQKAPRIQSVLATIRDRRGDFDLCFLAKLPTEDALRWLTSLHGVGPKTAACVLLFSLHRPVIPVDTHVLRVARRLGLVREGESAERTQAILSAAVAPERAYAAHMLLIQHGRTTCLARSPRCERCVLLDLCPTGRKRVHSRNGAHDN